MSLPVDDQPTRVVKIVCGDNTVADPDTPIKDETVILAAVPRETPHKKATFVPFQGNIKDGDNTVFWRPERGSLARELITNLRRGLERMNRRHLAVLCTVLFAFGLVIWLIGPKASAMEGKAKGDRTATRAVPDTAMDDKEPSVPSSALHSPPPTPLIPLETNGITLGAAADALLDGRLDEAMALYRRLADRFPQNRSFAMAAEILATAGEKRSK